MVRSGFRNFCFWNQFVSEMLEASYGLSSELRVGCFVWYRVGCEYMVGVDIVFVVRPW